MSLAPYPAINADWIALFEKWLDERPPEAGSITLPARYARLMCDYAAEGVWDCEGAAASCTSLPIPRPLHLALMIWQRRWEDLAEVAFDVARNGLANKDVSAWLPNAITECSAFGYRLACAIKLELPDWTIIYHDEGFYDVKNGALQGDPDFEINMAMATGAAPRPTAPLEWRSR